MTAHYAVLIGLLALIAAVAAGLTYAIHTAPEQPLPHEGDR